MKFGRIDRLLLLGGTIRLVNLITVTTEYQIEVYSNERLLEEELLGSDETLRQYLLRHKVKFHCLNDINRFEIECFVDNRTMGISLGAPWIFKDTTISKFGNKLINGHGSKLPRDKGGGGFSWRILNGDRIGYYLFHLVDRGIDTGDIIMQDQYVFPESCSKPKDYMRYHAENEVQFFERFLERIEDNYDFPRIKQQTYFATYLPRLNTLRQAYIDWSWDITDLVKFISAFDEPYSGASTFWKGKRVFIKDAFADRKDGAFHPFLRGIVYRKDEKLIYIATKEGSLVTGKVFDEDNSEVLQNIAPGDRFYTPSRYLEEAMEYIARY